MIDRVESFIRGKLKGNSEVVSGIHSFAPQPTHLVAIKRSGKLRGAMQVKLLENLEMRHSPPSMKNLIFFTPLAAF